ncbi:MAG: hypothetical protein QNK37_21610 [Acidobacteriota bacterium]|nr:hypothetical protein [Acidobacteriota bacterium]
MAITAHYLNAERLRGELDACGTLKDPYSWPLIRVATGGSNLSSAGFPYIVEESFRLFADHVPHLFADGTRILRWLGRFDSYLKSVDLTEDEQLSIKRTRKVIHNMVYTANITAPPDLWLLRQVLGVHRELGLIDILLEHGSLDVKALAAEKGLDAHQLSIDLHFLHSRGLLRLGEGVFHVGENAAARGTLEAATPLDGDYRIRMTHMVRDWIASKGRKGDSELLGRFFSYKVKGRRTGTWVPDWDQIELGYRLVPLVLGLRANLLSSKMKRGAAPTDHVTFLQSNMLNLLDQAGLLRDGKINRLGERVFQRGPGPFGIIAAYDGYLNGLNQLLHGHRDGPWVSRGENVAASQDANAKTFATANDALDRFCQVTGFTYDVFIEHAVGKGEATRQRCERSGREGIRYFGADLEDAAIDAALAEKERGELPANMEFIRNADIGHPDLVTSFLSERKVSADGAVMMVGNGFHEVRNQTNEQMVEVFKGYQKAGIFLIFTEETGLSDEDLLQTAWNTYHAGFRYVHEMSGQGLRPARTADSRHGRWSWARCASKAGYFVQEEYTNRTRTIYPYSKGRHGNPSISMTYFCVPDKFALKYGLTESASEDKLVSS